MRKALWILAALGLSAVLLLTWMSHSLVSSVAGVEEAQGLQRSFAASSGGVAAPETLRVARTVGAGEGGEFTWLVRGDLLPGLDPAGAAFALWRERVVARCLSTTIRGRSPAGVRLLLARGARPALQLDFDARGLPAGSAAPPPPPPPVKPAR